MAERQRGRLTTRQALAAGLTKPEIATRCRRGYLHRIERGLFAVGYRDRSFEGEMAGAVLIGGTGALASHQAAVYLLSGAKGDPPPLEISVPRGGGRASPDLTIHRQVRLDPAEVTQIDGIPCTVLPRALMDSAPGLGPGWLEQQVAAAWWAKRISRGSIRAQLDRSAGLSGVRMLRCATEELLMDRETLRSELERRFLALCRRRGAHDPLCNHLIRLGGRSYEVDFCWPDLRLIVETDGFSFHGDSYSYESDRARDTKLQLAGWTVFRVTWQQVTQNREVLDQLLDSYFGTARR